MSPGRHASSIGPALSPGRHGVFCRSLRCHQVGMRLLSEPAMSPGRHASSIGACDVTR